MNNESLLDLIFDLLHEWCVPLESVHLCYGCPSRRPGQPPSPRKEKRGRADELRPAATVTVPRTS